MDADNKNIFEVNKAKIAEYIAVNPEDTDVLDGSINLLIETGVGVISSVEILDADPWGWELLLVNSDNLVYYMSLTEYGSIAILRKDGPEGEELLSAGCGIMEVE